MLSFLPRSDPPSLRADSEAIRLLLGCLISVSGALLGCLSSVSVISGALVGDLFIDSNLDGLSWKSFMASLESRSSSFEALLSTLVDWTRRGVSTDLGVAIGRSSALGGRLSALAAGLFSGSAIFQTKYMQNEQI